MLPLLVGSALAPVLGGIIGSIAGSGDREKAQQAAQEAYNIIQRTNAPPDLSRQILLDKFQQVGLLTPEIEQNINQQFSKVAGIEEDPGLRNAQTSALQGILQRGRVGLSPEDRAALAEIRANNQSDLQGKVQQIAQNFAARGQGGSGGELAAALSMNQGSAQNQAMQGLQQAGNASRNALMALVQGGNLGSQIRGQDFDVNRVRAQAEDELNRFNLQNQMNNQMRNINRINDARLFNLQNQQQLANMNVQNANQERLRQLDAQRQYWYDQMSRAQAISNAKLGQANAYNQQGAQTAQQFAGIGAGVGAGLGSIGNYYQNQQYLDLLRNQNQAPSIAESGTATLGAGIGGAFGNTPTPWAGPDAFSKKYAGTGSGYGGYQS